MRSATATRNSIPGRCWTSRANRSCSAQWPTRYQTLHSPFRAKCLEQVRELLSNYGPIHGIWHDIFAERLDTNSKWTASGYQNMFGEPFDKASPRRLQEFNARTLAGYLDEVESIRREQRQEQCVYTANGSGSAVLGRRRLERTGRFAAPISLQRRPQFRVKRESGPHGVGPAKAAGR